MPRAHAPLVAVLVTLAGDHPAELIDISRTGARLRGEILPPVGEQAMFKAAKVNATVEVVWREAGSCAVEFDMPIAAAEVQRLQWLGLWNGSGRKPAGERRLRARTRR